MSCVLTGVVLADIFTNLQLDFNVLIGEKFSMGIGLSGVGYFRVLQCLVSGFPSLEMKTTDLLINH
jgi:hypothetical protein